MTLNLYKANRPYYICARLAQSVERKALTLKGSATLWSWVRSPHRAFFNFYTRIARLVHTYENRIAYAWDKRSSTIMIICFGGCGWMFPFHFGVAKYVQDELPQEELLFGGVSGGAAVGAALAYGIDVNEYYEQALTKIEDTGTFKMCDAVLDVAEQMFASSQCSNIPNGKLHIQLASPGMKGYIVSNYPSASFCAQVIRASSHIPIIGGIKPYEIEGHGKYYDGGLASLLPNIPGELRRAHRVVNVDALGCEPESDIHIGFKVPFMWSFRPRPLHVMMAIHHLGYLKAAQFFEHKANHREIYKLEEVIQTGNLQVSRL